MTQQIIIQNNIHGSSIIDYSCSEVAAHILPTIKHKQQNTNRGELTFR